jgi:uncharacterized protein YgiM (DUF1202 family)
VPKKLILAAAALLVTASLSGTQAAPVRLELDDASFSKAELVRGGGRGGRSRSYGSSYSSSRSSSYHYHAPASRSSRSSSYVAPVAGVAAGAAVGGAALAHGDAETRTKQAANVRADASPQGQVVQTLPADTAVRVLEDKGNWRRVATDGSAPLGWVHKSLLN